MEEGVANLLRQGIAAAKAGHKDVARILLTQVVERDEHNGAAWLWLAGVVDDLEERQICLENVLTLDPGNQAAQRGLEWVRGQKAAAPPVYVPPLVSESPASSTSSPLTPAAAMLRPQAPEPGYPVFAAEKPLFAPTAEKPLFEPATEKPLFDSERAPSLPQAEANALATEFGDEYLCPYCAAPTKEANKRCPACRGKLWRSSRKRAEPSTWFWILLTYLLLYAVGSFLVLAVVIMGALLLSNTLAKIKTVDQLVGLYMGIQTVPPEVAADVTKTLPPAFFWSMVAIVSIQFIQIALVYMRWRPVYWVLFALAGLSTLLSLAATLLITSGETITNLVSAFVPIALLLLIEQDFAVKRERIVCAPDKGIRTHSEYYIRGREYARQKMWALAAVHLKRAVGGSPRTLAYHLLLASCFAKLKRYERAESVLNQARSFAADDPHVRELSDLIAAARAHQQESQRSNA